MKFKEFKIDLGGNYPAKSEAVQEHATALGYTSNSFDFLRDPLLGLSKCGEVLTWSDSNRDFWNVEKGELVTAERFLELTKEDVTEKEPELFYRYRIWFKDGDTFETYQYLKEDIERRCLVSLSGAATFRFNLILKYERIGEGVEKCAGQK
jgi:hypothetical protein